MIQMSVGNNDSLNLFFLCYKIAHIRNNVINTWHIISCEFLSSINHENIVSVFYDIHVRSDLLKSSKSKYLNWSLSFFNKFCRILDFLCYRLISVSQKGFRSHFLFRIRFFTSRSTRFSVVFFS